MQPKYSVKKWSFLLVRIFIRVSTAVLLDKICPLHCLLDAVFKLESWFYYLNRSTLRGRGHVIAVMAMDSAECSLKLDCTR